MDPSNVKLIYVVTEDWYFCSHRLPLGLAAKKAGFDVSVITRVGMDGNRIRSAGLHLIPLDLERGNASFSRNCVVFFRLWRTLRKERPWIVHNVALKPVLLGTLAARLAGVRCVVNALAGLGYVFISKERRAGILRVLVKTLLRFLFRSRKVHVIVQNRSDESEVGDLGVSRDRISMISGAGVDLSFFKVAPMPNGPPVAAAVSRMLWDKGVGDLVDAARFIRKENHHVTIRLVGPTDPFNPSSIPEAELRSWVQEGLVEWVGPTSDVAGVWSRAHIGVLPSYREGLPKSLLEAAACGRPLIATDVPGCRDMVIHEETGLLVPPRDPRALADAILRLADDPALRARLGKAARERVVKHFSEEKVVAQTLALYRTILAAS